jgi:hypothetical protein
MAFLAIGRSKELGRYPLGPYIGVLLGDVESVGMIEYGHVLDVFDPRTGRRVFAVAAERNQLAGMKLGGGSHFICGYDGESHLNHGDSDDYADRDRFLAKARELVFDHFRLPREPLEKAIVAELAGPRDLPALPPEEEQERPARGGGSPALGMWLTLAGALITGLPLLWSQFVNNVPVELHRAIWPVLVLCSLGGQALFVVGCVLSARRLPAREGLWLWPAGTLAAVAALLIVLPIGLHAADPKASRLAVDRVSARGVFMLALLAHSIFLLMLSYRLGMNFHPRLLLLVVGGWVVMTGVVFFTTWMEGFPPRWVPLGILAGLAIWALVHLLVTGKAVSYWAQQRLAQ